MKHSLHRNLEHSGGCLAAEKLFVMEEARQNRRIQISRCISAISHSMEEVQKDF